MMEQVEVDLYKERIISVCELSILLKGLFPKGIAFWELEQSLP